MIKFIYNAATLALVCWSFYLGFIKAEPTIKDVALLAGIAALNGLNFKTDEDDKKKCC